MKRDCKMNTNNGGNTTNNGLDDGYKIAVKRRKGVPKSANKSLFYSRKFNGCEDTSLARAINKFETKHRRCACVDDVVGIFRKLQVEEPHGEILLTQKVNKHSNNFYSVIEADVYCCEEDPLTIQGEKFFQHVRRVKKIKQVHNMTFEEIIMEHKSLLDEEEHGKMLDKYNVPHSDDFQFQDADERYFASDDCFDDSHESKFYKDFMNNYSDLQPIMNQIKQVVPSSDFYVDIMEDLLYISYIMIYCDDPNILFGTLLTIYKKHTKSSISSSLYKLIGKLCFSKPKSEPQSLDFRSYMNKIVGLKNSILVNKITEGLSLCIAFGFINPINITVHNIKLFSVKASQITKDSTDYVSYIIDLLSYFFEIGYQVFSGNYERLFDGNELAKVDDDLIHLRTYLPSIQIGSYELETKYTIEHYHERLCDTINTLKTLSISIKDKVYRSLVLNKLTSAYQILVLFDQSKPLAGLRESPFSLSFYGKSSVGKSTSAKMILTNLLSYNNKACTDTHICTIQPTDKFYSTYKANTTGVIIDDLCNTRQEKAVVDPAQLLISIINNIPYYAPKSESNEKGKINVRPAVVVTTTNVENLEAHLWSNEPISVVRRLKYHIEVKVRKEYMTNNGLDSSKVTDDEIRNLRENGIQDLWLFSIRYVERFYVGGRENWRFTIVKYNDKNLEDIDIYDLIAFLNTKSEEHFKEQREFVELCKDSGLRHKNCKICKYPQSKCKCTPIDDSVQGGFFSIVDRYCEYVGSKAADYVLYSWNKILPGYIENKLYSPVLRLAIINYMRNNYLNLINYIPYSVRETNFYQTLHFYANRYKIYRNLGMYTILCIIPCTIYCRREKVERTKLLVFATLSSITLYRYTYSNIMNELKKAPLHTIIPQIQSHQSISTIFKVGVSVSVALLTLKTMKSFYCTIRAAISNKIPEPMVDDSLQGNLSPESYKDILSRDNEVNCWAKTTEKFIKNENTINMRAEHLVNAITPNILNLVMPFDEYSGASIGCVALKSNIFCCPLHFFKKDKNIYGKWRDSNVKPSTPETSTLYKLKFVKHDGESGNSFSATIDYNDIVRVGELDLCIFKVYSGGSFPDILKYCFFSKDSSATVTLRRNRMGTLIKGSAYTVHCPTSYSVPGNLLFNRTFAIQGGRATYDVSTSCGDCMMVHIRDTVSPSIIGFHISGTTGTCKGSYTMFTEDDIHDALNRLDKIHKIFTPHSGSFLNINRLGTMIKIDTEIPDKAPVSYVNEHNYIIRGTIDSQVSYFTEIKNTFMCSKVERIFNFDNIYAGPKFGPQRWKPYYTFLSSSAYNDNIMDTSILKLSMDDYVSPLLKNLLLYNIEENMRPLTHHEIINGIPGKRFIDHINFNSAIGYPLKGKKSKFMSGYPTNYDFAEKEVFMLEFEVMKTKYVNGERYYPIFKASLKDEPIPITKDKVRVFQAADITLQYGWRKYGLPILRYLSMYPLMSECAVGVNPYSEEWNQLHEHLTFNGKYEDRIVAGDYKSWDQKLPAQLVMAAFEVLIRIAKIIPTYTEEDIMMIKGLATDTTYYLSHFNGTLIEFNNGLPSGHNLTAHINSIANSLLLRYGYFLHKNPVPFRRYCHAITYGDDFETGVDPQIKRFDHLIYRKVVGDLGMTLTMPDKTSDPVPFLHIDHCDFLKRKSVKCDIDGIYYGALDFNSMLRSLLVRGKTSVSEREHAHSVIRGFIHDLSYHERKIYETNIEKVRELLDEINMIIPESTFTYDEYYRYRNRDLEWWQLEKEDTLDSATLPVGYPMTPEASGNSEFDEYYVSSTTNTSTNECSVEEGDTLGENNINDDSYLSTIVLGEIGDRIPRDDCVQSEVFGTSEDNNVSKIVETGTAVLTSSAEHSMQELKLVSSDILSLRQDQSRDLQYYLSRPRRIATYYPLTDLAETVRPPLFDFLNTPLIRDKIRNYAYINGVLHIKVVVVGSPTMAGSQLIALHPWWKRDNGLGLLNFGYPFPDLAQLSQLPSVMTDLSREKGGEISLPIICPSNGLDITRLEQIQDAFGLHYLPVVTTRIPGTSSIQPEVSVYAWMTDVSLTGTTLSSELPQSDEYHVPKHERPSSDHVDIKTAISKAGGNIVGKATEVGISKVMSAMGFSNPNSQDGVAPNVPRLVNNMSTYNGPTNIDSLAGDYKNEVSLDTKLLGYEDPDHMNLNNILSRWTIVDVLTVPTGITTGPTNCYVLPVTPMACYVVSEGNAEVFTPSALSMAALPFNRWRGAITYRFQAVGTAFMKGKIKISHDVKHPSVVSSSNRLDTQVLNSVIWDLATTNVIEIKVPWSSNQVFKNCGLLRRAVNQVAPDGSIAVDADANGALLFNQFTVVNDNDESGIGIIVSIKGEKGMVFGDMRAVLANYTFAGINKDFNGAVPQSGDFTDIDYSNVDFNLSNEYILYFKDGTYKRITPYFWTTYLANRSLDDQVTDADATPQALVYDTSLNTNILTGDTPGSIMAVNINGLEDHCGDHDELVMTCMGEKWFSIRQIIKRYTHNWTRNIVNDANLAKYYRIRLPDRPVLKGFQGDKSINVQPNNVRVTYARDSFLSFYSVAFLGYRGSIRHKVCVKAGHNATSYADQPMVSVSRSTGGYVEERVSVGASSNSANVNVISYSASSIPFMPDARAGATLGYSHVNPVLEYSTPYYSRGKFCWAQDRYPQLLKETLDGGYDVPWHQIIIYQQSNTNNSQVRVDKYVAAGDDFSLFFYLYGPRMVLDQPTSWPQV